MWRCSPDPVGPDVLVDRDELCVLPQSAACADAPLLASITTSASSPARRAGEREDGGGRETSRTGNELGVGDRRAIQFGESVHSAFQQVWMGVRDVPALIGRRVAQTEVGRKVDHADSALDQAATRGAAGSMG